jgi:hypothetical protein
MELPQTDRDLGRFASGPINMLSELLAASVRHLGERGLYRPKAVLIGFDALNVF